ncbi:uncharacterized protein ATNIH1004_004163 [Aspergillus tanneri]|uniref:Uncharacterized protein n=1 Tax=Aspergillus tanneri TaxID=1220188 RepID=A0A5M9MUI2_9EURO|nr:uncharacterized protein ATNIH1004_004163 [Aspergillus tanneri]KAA8648279.1 hypothetical protein ATNIH1004_004163 [Aspergillus tanneri]
MECFRQIVRLIKSPFERESHRVLEIGPPTNFRKEELPAFFSDDDALTVHSNGSTNEKEAIIKEMERRPSTCDKIKDQVRRLSVIAQRPSPDQD